MLRCQLLLWLTVAGGRGQADLQTDDPGSRRTGTAAPCPCSRAELCAPITTPLRSRTEIFGFGSGNWRSFDWSTLTTVVPTALDLTTIDPQLVCRAHANGARVVGFAPGGTGGSGGQSRSLMPLTGNITRRSEWVQAAVVLVQRLHLDGLNFDFEQPLNSTDPRRGYYTALVSETREALRRVNPTASVSVDVGWSPDNVDGRYYDYRGLSQAADFLYVMCCDVRSQVLDRCLAGANAPIGAATQGLHKFLELGVPAERLILGLPWYGYRYPCLEGQGSGTASLRNPTSPFCVIEQVPFRGVSCSDAAGGELAYVGVMRLLNANRSTTNGSHRDRSTTSRWFNYISSNHRKQLQLYQLWYDSPDTLRSKYAVAKSLSIGGVGPYEFSDLDYSNGSISVQQTQRMWAVLREFKTR
jgi:di-N-acetylchitobiase